LVLFCSITLFLADFQPSLSSVAEILLAMRAGLPASLLLWTKEFTMMRTMSRNCLGLVMVMGIAVGVSGDDKKNGPQGDPTKTPHAMPGPQHKAMDFLIGDWTYEGNMMPNPADPNTKVSMKGKISRRWVLDGRFIQEEVTDQSETPYTHFQGMGVMGYDNHKKKYVSGWIDNTSTSIVTGEGTWDPAAKTFIGTSEMLDPTTGKMVKSRDVMKVISNNEHHAEMFKTIDGKEVKVMTFTMKRQ